MDTVKVKTSELVGVALDWAVAQAVEFPVQYSRRIGLHCARTMTVSADTAFIRMGSTYRPSTDWSQCGPLIEEYRLEIIWIDAHKKEGWAVIKSWSYGEVYGNFPIGDTHLIAACLAIVSKKFGETVSIPSELMQ